MYRRRICKTGIIGLFLPLSGCLGRLDGISDGIETPETVTEAEFEFSDGRHEDSQNDPVIELYTEEARAIVTGTLLVGSGSCNEATLGEITYDADSGTVTVVVTWVDTSDEDEACTGDISSDEYEVRLGFGSLPSAITVEELDYRDEEYTTTEEIETS